ncbi:MAG: hypothetical protein JST54_01675 [Deltaproteobacteria bacterium]|nr:hypothetical protein [Deltaproteobacteria bacterium]
MSDPRARALAFRRRLASALWPLALAPILLGAAVVDGTRPDATSPRFPKGLAAPRLGPVAPGLEDWSQVRCASCHADEARAWAQSGHATARTNFVFQAALTADDPTWCLRCHAPLARDLSAGPIDPNAPAEERGVTCAACHAGHHAVTAAHASADAPHALEVSPHAGGSKLCAQCHEFGFALHGADGEISSLTAAPAQQDTFGEWTAWQAKTGDARGCLDCHGGGDHAFGGVRRPDALAAAIAVRPQPGALVLEARGAGHALPTGDVMRWLTVEAAADPLFEKPIVLARFGRTLGDAQAPGEASPHRTVTGDHRLQPGVPVRVALPLQDPPLIAWRLVMHLVSLQQEADGMLPAEASRVLLQSGYLANPEEKR